MVVFLVLMLGKCWSSGAGGLLLVIQQELTHGLSVDMNLGLAFSNPMLFPQSGLAYHLECSVGNKADLLRHVPIFSPPSLFLWGYECSLGNALIFA